MQKAPLFAPDPPEDTVETQDLSLRSFSEGGSCVSLLFMVRKIISPSFLWYILFNYSVVDFNE